MAGSLAAAGALAAGPAPCPPAGAPVHEHFIAADQPEAWTTAPAAPARPGWRLDWITPAGAEAPLSAAALPEAAERAERVKRAAGTAQRASAPARRLAVRAGPAWNGYFGLQLQLRPAPAGAPGRGLPPGSTGWLALVEPLPAGTEGSPVERALVRSVAGPLVLDGPGTASHLRALRWPEGARPERLQARAWVEAPDGRLLLMAADRCPPR